MRLALVALVLFALSTPSIGATFHCTPAAYFDPRTHNVSEHALTGPFTFNDVAGAFTFDSGGSID
jgi:hypothetical protein